MQAAKHGVGTDAEPQTGSQSGSSFAAEGIADLVEGLRLAASTAGIGFNQSGKALGEDSCGAVGLIAEKAAEP
jgi:hypothetical protein